MICRSICILALSFFLLPGFSQSIDELKQSQQEVKKKIELTNSLIKKNRKSRNASIQQLELMKNKIVLEEEMLDHLNSELVLIDQQIEDIDNRIVSLEDELVMIKDEYAKLIYTSWRMSKAGKDLHYILAGYDLQMVYRRFRYILDFNRFRRTQAKEIDDTKEELAKAKILAEESRLQKTQLIVDKNDQLAVLNNSRSQKQSVVNSLSKEEKKLRSTLKQQQKRADELDNFIQEIIKKEIASRTQTNNKDYSLTPEQKLIGQNFSENYSRLPWPVEQGVITLGYGPYTPPGHKRVTLNSNGVEITTSAGSEARAVFNGTVVGVYALPGYNTGVIIKHGEYFTFYANLESVYVKQGQNIDHKQKVGKIYVNPESGNSVLHFEIYKDKTHVNPQSWLSK